MVYEKAHLNQWLACFRIYSYDVYVASKDRFPMDTKFIQTLLSVVDTGSFAAAARNENLTPAAVSQRVRSLEAELGEALIVRSGQQVVPTPACLSILARMRHIAREVRQIATDFDASGRSCPATPLMKVSDIAGG